MAMDLMFNTYYVVWWRIVFEQPNMNQGHRQGQAMENVGKITLSKWYNGQ